MKQYLVQNGVVCSPKKIIRPKTITQVEFIVDRISQVSRNTIKACLGIVSQEGWLFNDHSWHYNVIGDPAGFSIYASGTRMHLGRRINDAPFQSGDRVTFIFDNGFSDATKTSARYILNGEDKGEMVTSLEVTDYRAAMSLCCGQHVSLTKIQTLQSKRT
jgi:hypothetical protein